MVTATLVTRVVCALAVIAAGLTEAPNLMQPSRVLSSDLIERTELVEVGVIRLGYSQIDNDTFADCPYDAEPANTPGGALVGFQHTWDEQFLGDCDTVHGYEVLGLANVRALKNDGALVSSTLA